MPISVRTLIASCLPQGVQGFGFAENQGIQGTQATEFTQSQPELTQ